MTAFRKSITTVGRTIPFALRFFSFRFATSSWKHHDAPHLSRWLVALLCLVLSPAFSIAAEPVAAKEKSAESKEAWIQLFNGKDLDGWKPKIKGYDLGDNCANTFRVENGVLKVGYEGYDKFDSRFGHLFYRESFSNYRLRVEYRFVGDQCPGGPGWATRKSGVMIHV